MDRFADVAWGIAAGVVGLVFAGLAVLFFGVVVAAAAGAVVERIKERRKE